MSAIFIDSVSDSLFCPFKSNFNGSTKDSIAIACMIGDVSRWSFDKLEGSIEYGVLESLRQKCFLSTALNTSYTSSVLIMLLMIMIY